MKIIFFLIGILMLCSCSVVENVGDKVTGMDKKEDAYLSAVRERYPDLKSSDEDLVDAGKGVCKAFDDGASAKEFIFASGANTTDQILFVAYVMGAAVQSFCPEHKDKLKTSITERS